MVLQSRRPTALECPGGVAGAEAGQASGAGLTRIRKGTPGLARKSGGKWVSHHASRNLTLADGRPYQGGYLIFRVGQWELMVLAKHCNDGWLGKKAKRRRRRPWKKPGTFNRGVLGRNGKGASRRKNRVGNRRAGGDQG